MTKQKVLSNIDCRYPNKEREIQIIRRSILRGLRIALFCSRNYVILVLLSIFWRQTMKTPGYSERDTYQNKTFLRTEKIELHHVARYSRIISNCYLLTLNYSHDIVIQPSHFLGFLFWFPISVHERTAMYFLLYKVYNLLRTSDVILNDFNTLHDLQTKRYSKPFISRLANEICFQTNRTNMDFQ